MNASAVTNRPRENARTSRVLALAALLLAVFATWFVFQRAADDAVASGVATTNQVPARALADTRSVEVDDSAESATATRQGPRNEVRIEEGPKDIPAPDSDTDHLRQRMGQVQRLHASFTDAGSETAGSFDSGDLLLQFLIVSDLDLRREYEQFRPGDHIAVPKDTQGVVHVVSGPRRYAIDFQRYPAYAQIYEAKAQRMERKRRLPLDAARHLPPLALTRDQQDEIMILYQDVIDRLARL